MSCYFDGYFSERLPANLIQAQRDFFGAHTYRRTDMEGIFHTHWDEESSNYNLGTIGLGHWVKRLHQAVKQSNALKLVKTVGTRSYDQKRDELERYGLGEKNYYQIIPNTMIPDEFFNDLDIVHIASPNQFHKNQTIQSLSKGKFTVVEKTFATNRKDFEEIMSYIINKK